MITLSAQIDGLRKAAQNYRDLGKHEAEQMLLDAADTIWQLRDDLQRVTAENIKLRMELALREPSEQEKVIEYLRQENVDWEDMYRALKAENAKLRDEVDRLRSVVSDGADNARELQAENAKLRERAVAMLSELRGVVSEGDYDSPSGRYFLLRRDVAAYEDALRELGIEG